MLCGDYFILFIYLVHAAGERTLVQTEYVNLMRYVGQRMEALLSCG